MRGGMMRRLYIGVIVLLMLTIPGAALRVRIKDIAFIRGIRENQLLGYGLVVGLNGRGDSARSSLTKTTIRTFLKNFGVNLDDRDILLRNSAVVVVTATIPPFSNGGDRIDVTVSSLADARTLAGGVLLQTALRAADNRVYAVCQGQVLVSGSRDTTLNVGRIPKGGIVERGVGASYIADSVVRIATRDRDFTTVNNIGRAVTNRFPGSRVRLLDPATVDVVIPVAFRKNPVGFISLLERIEVDSDTPARVVVDGKSGTVVMGENVRISTVAVSYNGIKINVGSDPFADSEKKSSSFFVLGAGASVRVLVDGLNRIGARPKDVINILQAIEKAGALKARLIIM